MKIPEDDRNRELVFALTGEESGNKLRQRRFVTSQRFPKRFIESMHLGESVLDQLVSIEPNKPPGLNNEADQLLTPLEVSLYPRPAESVGFESQQGQVVLFELA